LSSGESLRLDRSRATVLDLHGDRGSGAERLRSYMSERKNLPRQVRYATATASSIAAGTGRSVSYVLSNSEVARDGHRILTAGWDLTAYLTNPVFLWAHDDQQPPIGRMAEIGVRGDELIGTVDYCDADISPFADMIFRMVKGLYLNTVSVSWMPLESRFSTDKTRQGGIDFLRQELLEVSQVPVPALASAVATARAAGIDTAPLIGWAERILDGGGKLVLPRDEVERLRKAAAMPTGPRRSESPDWKCGAAEGLTIKDTGGWDGADAEKRIFTWAGFDGDAADGVKARRAFLAYDAADPDMKTGYKLPFCDIIDGELFAIKGGLDAAAASLDGAPIPGDVKAKAKSVIDAYQAKGSEGERSVTLKRGLYECGWLATCLSDLAWLQECCEFEAAGEGDNSPVPAAMKDCLAALGQVLIDMTTEEVGELVSTGEDYAVEADQDPRAAASMLARKLAPVAAQRMAQAMRALLAGDRITIKAERSGALIRAGRVLSADNERCLREAHDQMTRGCDMVRSVFEQVGPEENPENDAPDPSRAGMTDDDRARRAKALAARARLIAAE
jgi:hypothetical protein